VVRELFATPNGGYEVTIELDRATHHHSLAEIEATLLHLGFNVVQAEITELATSAIEGAFLGGASGGAAGAATRNPWAAFAGLVIGAVVGHELGKGLQTIKTLYRADRLYHHPGGWHLTQLPLPQPAASQQPIWPFA